MNSDRIIYSLKAQVEAERKDKKKYMLYGAGVGIAVVGVLVAILK